MRVIACGRAITETRVTDLLEQFQPLFEEELKRASFSKKDGQTIISFLAPKIKIIQLEKVIHEALVAFARLN